MGPIGMGKSGLPQVPFSLLDFDTLRFGALRMEIPRFPMESFDDCDCLLFLTVFSWRLGPVARVLGDDNDEDSEGNCEVHGSTRTFNIT